MMPTASATAWTAATFTTSSLALASRGRMRWFAFRAIEVRFIVAFGKVGASLDGDAFTPIGTHHFMMLPGSIALRRTRSASLSSHLGTLFSQDRLARQLDAIAFDGEHLYQDLITFVQFVTHVLNAMFSDLADVEQAVGSREDFDKRAEIGEANHLSEIRLSHFGRCRDVA